MGASNHLIMDGICFKVNNKAILNNVSMTAKSGELLAIMGQSAVGEFCLKKINQMTSKHTNKGSGKTTSLNIIAGRQTPDTGSISLNGEVFDKRLRRRMAFVQQRDVFFSQLTLKETLEFSARLRISDDVPWTRKLQIIDGIVKSLQLEKCLNTVIGDIFTFGLSGGEKKRASIACELLSDPDILLLDEPTSGLDSSTASNIMEFLQRYAKQHDKLVVSSIHQPSSKIYHMFHTLLILSNGKIAYSGRRKEAIPLFTKLGAVFEPENNPADVIMDFVATFGDSPQGLHVSVVNARVRVDHMATSGTKPKIVPEEISDEKWLTSWWTQYKVLSSRSLKQSMRVLRQGYSLVQAICVAVVCSLFYYQVGLSLETSRDVYGLIFHLVGYWTYAPATTALASYGNERHVIVKERASGAYRLSAYFLGKMTGDLPDSILIPGTMYSITYWTGGLGGPKVFFITLIIMFVQSLACSGLGLLAAITCRDVRKALTSLFSYVLVVQLAGGYFSRNPPYWMEWLQYCSVFYYPYAFTISCITTTTISDIPCNFTLAETFPSCLDNSTSFVTSVAILEAGNVHWPSYAYAMVVVAYMVFLRLAGYVVMRLKNEKIV